MRRQSLFLLLFSLAGPAQPDAALKRGMLASHNAVRANLRIAPLVWSDRLAERAQQWADTLLQRGQFFHRPNSAFGENLYEIRGASATPSQVVKAWASELRNYDYRANSCHGVCGHYTQIVWRGTQEVGCGVARGRGREIWVCNYNPPGNYIGRRPY